MVGGTRRARPRADNASKGDSAILELQAVGMPFVPRSELQNDTSPHETVVGASRARCGRHRWGWANSRMRLVRPYPRFTRFECEVFPTDPLVYFDGTCQRGTMTAQVVLVGTGRGRVPRQR
jgi:hypothetical protein